MALLDYIESKQKLVLLKLDAENLAKEFDGFAKVLRQDPTRIDNPDGSLPTYKEVFDFARRFETTAHETARLHDAVAQLGLVTE
jgi:hypothetical protein